MNRINNGNIKFARELCGISVTELASRVGISKQAISQFENGQAKPSNSTLKIIARELKVDFSFFNVDNNIPNINSPIYFRKLSKTTKRARMIAERKVQIFDYFVRYIKAFAELPNVNLPKTEYDFMTLTNDDIDEIALKLRKFWRISLGPISNLSKLLEYNGIIVCPTILENELDAFSLIIREQPFIVNNISRKSVRSRANIAHELGHLILHTKIIEEDLENPEIHEAIEKQAWYFAMSFMLPEESFAKELFSMNLDNFIQIKERWKISIQAMIMRSYDIGLISEESKTNLFRQINIKGIRRNEPYDDTIEVEEPELIKKAIKILIENEILDKSNIINHPSFINDDLMSNITGFSKNDMISMDTLKIIPFPKVV